MADIVTAENVQRLAFNVTTDEGPSFVTVVTGTIRSGTGVGSSGTNEQRWRLSLRALLDYPALAPGKFRKATATAAFSGVAGSMEAAPNAFEYLIEEVRASLDDETGKVELLIDGMIAVTNGNLAPPRISFQVTTLAMV